jgi:hypothetical protein
MVPALLPSGREILIPSNSRTDLASQDLPSNADGFSDVAFHLEFKDLVDVATEIAVMLRKSMEMILPQKATVELSIGVDAKSGQLTAFFVEGGANGALKLTLEWGGQPAESP